MSESSFIGITIAQRYRVERKLGQGPVGTLYAGRHLDTDQQVAIKILNPDFVPGTPEVDAALADGRTASELAHPHLVPMLDQGVHESRFVYIVEPLLEGQSLADQLGDGPLPVEDVVRMGRGVLRGIGGLHDAGLTHLDLKPSNIFLIDEGDGRQRPVVSGVGIAHLLRLDDARKGARGRCLARPEYLAPECIKRGGQPDARSDIYAFGVLMYEALTGRPPFTGNNFSSTAKRHVYEKPLSVRLVRPQSGIPENLDALVMQCLGKAFKDRFETVAAVARALYQLVESGLGGDALRAEPSFAGPPPLALIAAGATLLDHPAVPTPEEDAGDVEQGGEAPVSADGAPTVLDVPAVSLPAAELEDTAEPEEAVKPEEAAEPEADAEEDTSTEVAETAKSPEPESPEPESPEPESPADKTSEQAEDAEASTDESESGVPDTAVSASEVDEDEVTEDEVNDSEAAGSETHEPDPQQGDTQTQAEQAPESTDEPAAATIGAAADTAPAEDDTSEDAEAASPATEDSPSENETAASEDEPSEEGLTQEVAAASPEEGSEAAEDAPSAQEASADSKSAPNASDTESGSETPEASTSTTESDADSASSAEPSAEPDTDGDPEEPAVVAAESPEKAEAEAYTEASGPAEQTAQSNTSQGQSNRGKRNKRGKKKKRGKRRSSPSLPVVPAVKADTAQEATAQKQAQASTDETVEEPQPAPEKKASEKSGPTKAAPTKAASKDKQAAAARQATEPGKGDETNQENGIHKASESGVHLDTWFVDGDSVEQLEEQQSKLSVYQVPEEKERSFFLPVLLSVAALVGGLMLYFSSSTQPSTDAPDAEATVADQTPEPVKPPGADPKPEATPPKPPANPALQIEQAARQAFEEQKWSGSQDALAERLQALRALQPTNKVASRLESRAVNRLLAESDDAQKKGDWTLAETHLRHAGLISPKNPLISTAQENLAKARTMASKNAAQAAEQAAAQAAAEKAAAEQAAAEKAAAEKAAADKAAAEKAAADKAAAEKAAAEKAAAEKAAAEKAAAEKAAAAKAAADKAAADKAAADKAAQLAASQKAAQAQALKDKRAAEKAAAARKRREAAEARKKREAEAKAKRDAAKAAERKAATERKAEAKRLVGVGKVHIRNAKWSEARKSYSAAIKLDKSNAAAYAGLGKVAFQEQKFSESVRNAERSVKLSPRNADYRVSLGLAYFKLKKFGQAKSAWEKALTLSPSASTKQTANKYLKIVEKRLKN
ncbi:MAG: protein kinase domain-containing protein [Bradymonadia bacterium]